jgi:hypothetical protein
MEGIMGRYLRRFVVETVAVGVALVGVVGCTGAPPVGGEPSPAEPDAWRPPVGEWALTAPSPLSSRYDALAFFAEGKYYVLGGYSELTHEILNNDWDAHGEPLFDGASYDPATNKWTELPSFSSVFQWMTSSSAAAVVGNQLYVVSPMAAPLHVYNGDPSDTGDRVAAFLDLHSNLTWAAVMAPPPTSSRADQVMMATDEGIFLFADDYGRTSDSADEMGYVFHFATRGWVKLPPPPQKSLASPKAVPLGSAQLLLSTSPEWDDDGKEVPGGLAIFDLATQIWRAVDSAALYPRLDLQEQGVAVVDGVAVVAGRGPKVDSPPEIAICEFAGVGGATADVCDVVALSREAITHTGGLAGRFADLGGKVLHRNLTTGAAAEAFYNLFDPRTNVLWPVPWLPGVHYDEYSTAGELAMTVMAAGGNTVLSCFGYEEQPNETVVNHDECYLLPVPNPLPG